MIRFNLYLILMCLVTSTQAQLADSLWFFFEDAIGNKDSVLYGGVYQGSPIPPKYQGSEFNAFDEEFEVGIANFLTIDDPPPNEQMFSKYSVQSWLRLGREFSDWNLIYVRLKHPPLKITYRGAFFDKFISSGSWMTSDNVIAVIPPFGYDRIQRFTCLHDRDSLFWDLGTKYMDLDVHPIHTQANIKTGQVDTIWGLRHSDLYTWENEMDVNCPYRVSTNTQLNDLGIEVFQSAGNLQLSNSSGSRIESIRLTNLSGQVLYVWDNPLIRGGQRSIDVGSIGLGVYIMTIGLESGHEVSQKLVLGP